MTTFLDTHAWMWWVTADPRMSKRAHSIIRKSRSGAGIWISAISIWEIAKKVQKGQLTLDRPVNEWLDLALSVERLCVAELTQAVLVKSCELPQPFSGDPADQMIVASVLLQDGRLITKDEQILRYPYVRTVW